MLDKELTRLLDRKEIIDRAEFRSDPDRAEAEHRWLVQAVEHLLRKQLGLT